jgi:hypothetical protein
MADELVIKNGNKVREWVLFIGAIIGLVITAALGWGTICNRVDRLNEKMGETHTMGTLLSQQNTREIIEIKADVRYTRGAVDKLTTKIETLSDRIPRQ